MPKIIVLSGLPASGKTTWAKKWVEEEPTKRIRVCRDDIRHMLGKYWVPEREDIVTEIEQDAVYRGLEQDYDVVVDATNFRKNFWKLFLDSLSKTHYCQLEYKFFDTPLEECIERDSKREVGKVGKEVIMNMYNKYLKKGEQDE